MTKKHVYEQPKTTVHQLEEICGLLAASGETTLDKNNAKEETPEGELDAKENTLGTTLWND